MGGISIWQILIILFIFSTGILPWLCALCSKKVQGKHKFIWFIMSFFISWLGYLVYYFTIVKELPENKT
ncbi:hypothetical protein BI198_14820 [Rheinheimera salexigens]|uniref:Cardiolipin synthase N-terminal domain-containing protein n=1 Tax=Rheinheimera salexigens TaxID=1628148 RepID=A0A1E7QAF1_9GAMM|nr:hypothetical protein BI198_14820 [Rheinheimera salexigens]